MNLNQARVKILSTLEHLFPEETTWEEIKLIRSGNLELIERSDHQIELIFKVSPVNISLSPSEQEGLEKRLLKKLGIIFKWFPGYSIHSVSVLIEDA